MKGDGRQCGLDRDPRMGNWRSSHKGGVDGD